MKVSKLIELLSQYDDDTEVVLYNSCKTGGYLTPDYESDLDIDEEDVTVIRYEDSQGEQTLVYDRGMQEYVDKHFKYAVITKEKVLNIN